MPHLFRFLSLQIALIFGAFLFSASADPVKSGPVEAELIAAPAAIQPGQTFQAALHLEMEPKWHVYWTNPGSPGKPPNLTWELPEGFTASELQFPAPHDFEFLSFISFGYEDAVTLVADITAPDDLEPGTEIVLQAKADWLVCEETCVPGKADLSLTLPVVESGSAVEDSPNAPLIQEAVAQFPQPQDWELTAALDVEAKQVTFSVTHGGAIEGTDGLFFFPSNQGLSKGVGEFTNDGEVLTYAVETSKKELPDALSAVITAKDGFSNGAPAVLIGAEAASAGTDSTVAAEDSSKAPMSLLLAMGFAFLGGLILNLMPCVFPVISLKIMGFVQQAGESRGKVIAHGVVFTLGVLISFWILASVLLISRTAGGGQGWGFQLQNPAFIMAVLIVLTLVSLNLAGVFEIGASLTGVGGKLASASGFGGSFWSGVLATVLATPCTAPFMAPAITAALALPTLLSLLIFTALGLGMAFPYLFFSIMPGMTKILPRPGAWMETFKQIMAFPMLLVLVWLIWVLTRLIGADGLAIFLIGLVLVSFGAWFFGRFGAPERQSGTRNAARAVIIVSILGASFLAWKSSAIEPAETELITLTEYNRIIEEKTSAGEAVFVDFTAAWCLTCQANKGSIHSDKVEAAFEEQNVHFLEVDWTREDPEILTILEQHGRASVPLYLLYDPKDPANPAVLPNILTPGIILNALEEI